MKTETHNYNLPVWSLCALINDDYSGNTDGEECAIRAFLDELNTYLEKLNATHYTIDAFSSEESFFCTSPDIGGMVASNCKECPITFFIED